jgi:long-chain fatty acid transport protein
MAGHFSSRVLAARFLASASAMILLGVAHAHAGAFGLREQSAAGQGASFAGAAAGAAGLGSMFWNPSAITMVPGIQFEQTFSLILPNAKLTPGAGSSPSYLNGAFGGRANSGDVAQDAVLPAGYGSYQVNDRLWVGIQANAPFGLTTKPESNWAGRAYGDTTKVVSFGVTPTVGYKINDWLSLGGGVNVLYFKAKYQSAVPSAATVANWGVAGLEGDSMGVGVTLGATLTPMPGTTIGVGYRSMVQEELTGDFRAAGTTTPFKATAHLPETVTIGLRQVIGDRFTALAGAEWTNWSRVRYPRVYNENTGTLLAASPFLPLGYRDGWFFSVGGEYAVTPQWAVRAGIAYEVSPIDTDVRTLRLADNDRIWASIGATYRWNEKISFDVGYSHIFPADTTVAIQQGNPSYRPQYQAAGLNNLVGKVDAHVDIISVALRYRWDDPSKPAGVMAVKAKY